MPTALLLITLIFGAGRPAEAQIWDKVKDAASRTVQEAGRAAQETAMEEGMKQATFAMIAEGGFAGTVAPWIAEGEPVAFAEVPGNAYVSPRRLAIVLCGGADALDGIVLQGDFSNVTEPTDLFLADGNLAVFLVQDGRSAPMRGNPGQLGSLTTGSLSLEPEGSGVRGTVSLSVGEDAVGGRMLQTLFERSRVVEVEGSFRAQPVESIEQINCGG